MGRFGTNINHQLKFAIKPGGSPFYSSTTFLTIPTASTVSDGAGKLKNITNRYLSNDLQMYMITSLTLMIYSKKKLVGGIIFLALFLGSIIATASIVVSKNYHI